MNIQWYPGHMTKARRAMKEDMKLIDLVIELVDARVPFSSRNPDIDELAAGKARMVLLNKADLADEAKNAAWWYWKENGWKRQRCVSECGQACGSRKNRNSETGKEKDNPECS